MVASVLVGLCNVLSDLRFFYSFVDFFNDLMKYNHGFFSPWFFFVRFSVSCFFKMRKVFLLNELDCLLIEL